MQPGLSEHALVEALGVYQSHEAVAPELLARLGRATNWNARAYAASVVGACADRLADPLALLRPLVADEHSRVRLQAVVACTYVARPEAMEVAAIAADFPADKFVTYALNQAVFALKPQWLPAFKVGKLNLENKPSRLGLLIRADGTPDTLNALREQVNSSTITGARRETFLNLLAEVGNTNDLARLLDARTFTTGPNHDAAQQARVLPTLAGTARVRNVRPAGDLVAALRPLIESPNDELRAEAIKLAGVWKLETFRPVTEAAALDGNASEKTRRAAVDALASLGGDASKTTLSRLSTEGPPSIQSAAIAALCGLDLNAAARLAGDSFARLSDETALGEIFTAFLQRQGGAAALAKVLASAARQKQAAEVGLRVMNTGGRRNKELAVILTDAANFNGAGKSMTQAETVAFVAEINTDGDANRGERIFRNPGLGCVACHSVNGQGGNIGPDLSALGTAQPVDFIIGAILEPQKEIKEGYVSISVTTKDGEEYQGYQVRETSDELVLRDVLQNKEVRLRRDTIKERKQNGSVMPNGLADTLTREEFRDLVRFLSELGKPK